jgi:hypothetical protein
MLQLGYVDIDFGERATITILIIWEHAVLYASVI